ncbi:MAG: type I methionyl aminopeptidase [candidate division KSB1 bacterium]|nr:type I methionyl aminopeptidase [candidate division KSB1 bacterium]
MIYIRSSREIELIRKSCQIVVETFALVESLIRAGIKTSEIDSEIEKFIVSKGGRPAFKGFHGYPANACISIDNQVVHGIPGSRRLEAGQIVSVDIGVEREGYFGDGAKTFAVGKISEEKKRLMEVTRQALYRGIEAARVGNRLSDISHAIQETVERAGYSVVRELVGHGVGRQLHEEPQIPNFGKPHRGPRLKPGMVLAIEPMVNMGSYKVITKNDNWTVETWDGLPSAHFEHTVVVTEGEPDILTSGL